MPSLRNTRSRHRALLVGTLLSAVSAPAFAQRTRPEERLSLHLEGGVGQILPEFQRTQLGMSSAFLLSARIGVRIIDPLEAQAAVSTWLLPTAVGMGQQTLAGGGLRFQPRLSRLGRLVVDADFGAGFTGPYTRWMLEAGIAYEFDATSWLAIGPSIRYAVLFTNDSDIRSDAHVLTTGLVVTLRVPPARPAPRHHARVVQRPQPSSSAPPPDRDGDRIPDSEDVCPDVDPGEHPDPSRPGCPFTDLDGDHFFDNVDQCVRVPAGPHPDPERVGCPDEDDDGDGVPNHVDECRALPVGIHPDAEHPGCPAPDRDGDSVPDATDHCPSQAGAPSLDPNRNGCPGLVTIRDGAIRIARPVFFASNRDRILARSNAVLEAVVDAMRATPEIRRVSVDGHTDSSGDDARNMALSQRRADSVLAWLVAHGVDPARLEAHGYGETRPIASNRTAAGRATNRRVEFRITDPASADDGSMESSPTEGMR